MKLRLLLLALVVSAGGVIAGAQALNPDPLDPVRNVALPCEAVSTPGLVPRAAKNIAHVANVCGFVGTDIEFQSRRADDGVHDYAFVGTMGGGTRIFDVTDPAHPVAAGRYTDPGYQNDVQVSGNLLVLGFDSLGVSGAVTSNCLRGKGAGTAGATRGGVDIVRLVFDPETATFRTELADCYLSTLSSAGAHTTTVHPSGKYLTVNTSFNGIEVVDIRTTPATLVRTIPEPVADDAHDVSFSRDGNTLYSAGLDSTRVLDVTDIFNRAATVTATIPNAATAEQGGDGQVIQLSHQSDTSSDGKILVVTDEAGGGITETGCNQGPSGKIGAAHFWNLAVSPARKLGSWLYPNPVLAPDPLAPVLASIGRTERACTIHVFRNGGNGTAGPGAVASGLRRRLQPARPAVRHRPLRRRHLARRLLEGVELDRRRPRGSTLDLGQRARLERHARRRDLVGEGVQGLRLHGRHDPRLRRLLADDLRGRRLRDPADEHAGPGEGPRRRRR